MPTVTADEIRDRLAAAALPAGGWGYHPGQAAHLEPTCLGVLALSADPAKYSAAIAGGWAAVESHAHAEGSYRLTRGRPQAAWPTAVTLFTKSVLGQRADAARDRLLSLEGRVVKADPEIGE